jgi:hypothetical protein
VKKRIEQLAEPADLFEMVFFRNSSPAPRKLDPRKHGIMSRYFLSFVDGFIARMGGSLELYSHDNKNSSEIQQNGRNLVVKVLGVPIVQISSKKMRTPPLEVGSPGYSHIEMYSGDQKYYVYVTPTGKMGVRKTPPPKAK